jgi:copper chaperone CopZ
MKLVSVCAVLALITGVALAKEATTGIKVPKMDCDACAVVVRQALAKTKGVKNAKIEVDKRVVTVVYDDSLVTDPQLRQIIQKTGFEVEAPGKAK